MCSLSSKSIALVPLSAAVLALVGAPVLAASPEVAGVDAHATSSAQRELRAQPSPLLAIDQNRATVVDRVVREWGDALAAANVGLDREQLRSMLTGLRADHLLAASLAGSLEGLRNSLSKALMATAEGKPSVLQAKALGDTADDLVYTPVVPCRLADTRFAGGPIVAFSTRNFKVWVSSGGFTAQGGDAGNCNVPANPPAVVLNFAAVNPTGTGNLIAYPTGAALPNTSVLNYQSGTYALSNGAIIPACVPACANQLSVKANGPTVDVVIDIVGYFATPKNYGGMHVITGLDATDSGGYANTASGAYSTVGGGFTNTASGYDSTVAGGSINTASSNSSAVAGGSINTASGAYSTVAGGGANTASGAYSTVAGGVTNTASGQHSFAAGTRAKTQTAGGTPTIHDGVFIWADANSFDFNSLAANEFAVRAAGGVRLVLAIDGSGNPTWTCSVSGGGSWACSSDRNLKQNLRLLDGKEVLRKVAALAIFQWNPKGENAHVNHLGPTAQDFFAAFGLGDSELRIGQQDADGVALAAIQGLHQMLQEKQRKISRLEAKAGKVDRLERKLQALEAKLGLN